jgi:hypothetical protein
LPSVRVFMWKFFLCSELKPSICCAVEAQVWEPLGKFVRAARACHVVIFYDDLAKWTAIEVIDGIG